MPDLALFVIIAVAGLVLIFLGTSLQSRVRTREREQGGVQIMTMHKDNTESQDKAFEALRAELAGLRVMVPGMPSLPARPVDYEGWFEDAFKRMQMRSEQRTLDEQNKILTRYDQLYRQYLGLMKTTYDIVLKTHDFKRLGETVALDDSELKLKRRQIDIRMKELELREVELDRDIKLARDDKPKTQDQNLTDEDRFRAAFKPAHDIAAVRAVEKELLAKYSDDTDVQQRIKRIASNLCERLMEGRR
jgi:hypothetical protein